MGKILTHHEIIGHIAEQIESVITYPPPPPPLPPALLWRIVDENPYLAHSLYAYYWILMLLQNGIF